MKPSEVELMMGPIDGQRFPVPADGLKPELLIQARRINRCPDLSYVKVHIYRYVGVRLDGVGCYVYQGVK